MRTWKDIHFGLKIKRESSSTMKVVLAEINVPSDRSWLRSNPEFRSEADGIRGGDNYPWRSV